MLERLQKIISAAGITSRRASEELILAGRVTVNGTVVTELGSKADPAHDTITVDGKPLTITSKKLYILLYKPVGYMTTLDDPEGRPLVTDLLKEIGERVYPVGRLDYNTEGLLLLTNDGEWANHLMHPRHEVEKEYHVRVRGKVHKSQLEQLAGGVEIDARKTASATVRMIKEGEQNDWFSLTIHEGRNRQVRRMCEAVSLSVVRLRRVRYGMLSMGVLKPGEFRFLTEAEVSGLRNPNQKQDTAASRTQASIRSAASSRSPQRPAATITPSRHTPAGKRSSSPKKHGAPRRP
ncbi:MAG: rRNA pseudouridine synthase [Verrucomicrobia bacterium]|nr:rRNA pseudouridine synthase [Deltaproteobacteria bacterium]